jgi:acyl carrier protein
MSDDSIETRVKQVAADVFNLPASRISRETSPQSVEKWDSVEHLSFVLALEAAFGVQLEPEDIEQIRSVGGAIDVVRRKLA